MTANELKAAFWGKIKACRTVEELQALAWESPAAHLACFTKISNKEGELETLRPNILQLRMSMIYETFARLGLPCRMVVCKIRQCGGTEMGLHIGYHHSIKRRTRAIAISDKRPNSKKLVKRLVDRHKFDSFPWGVRIRAVQEEAFFTNESYWEIESAENHKAGIGDTRQFALFSEVGKWPKTTVVNDEAIMGAVMPSLAKIGFSCAVAESTPDGASGWQYEKYTKEAISFEDFIERVRRGERPIVWIKVFAGWFEFDENRISYLNGKPPSKREIAEMKRTITAREHDGIQRYGWDWDQIAWRRAMISMDCNGDEDIFDCYYPEDDVRCWAVAGRPRFNMTALMAMERRASSKKSMTGYLTIQPSEQVVFSLNPEGAGDIEIWEEPRQGCRYLVACDPATGKSNTAGADPDRNSVQVWRSGYHDGAGEWHKAAMVARVRGPNYDDGDEVALAIAKLSRFYGRCLVVLEVNQGLHVLDHLKDAGVPLYKREVPSLRPGQVTEQFGFKLTDQEQRRQVIEGLAAAIRDENIDVWCKQWITESKTFITTASGKYEARPGCHDDDVMCGAMAWLSLPSATEYRGPVRRRAVPKDRKDWHRLRGPVSSWQGSA
jgi:hypothetical protein